MRANVVSGMQAALRAARTAGPYLLIELVLPGGSLVALGLYVYRNGPARTLADLRAVPGAVMRTGGGLFDHLALPWQPAGGPDCAGDAGRSGGAPCGPLVLPGC